MPRADTATAFELPDTIAGLWSLCALVPLSSRDAYEEAAEICGKLAVRRLNAVQRDYQRELLALVEAYEDQHDEDGETLARVNKLASA